MRRVVKAVVQAAFVYVWASLRNLARACTGRAHVTVLLYHRVSDEFQDNVTVGVEQFARQMRLLKRRYEVLDLPAFLAARGQPRRRPAVVITFDDGYADNHQAARILRDVGLPATFFISTSIVGTERAFPHDLRKLGRRVPALSWEQVREMADWGFHIAPHTASHVNVADLPLDEAKAEIRASIEEVVKRLGARGPERWFAYPHGRPGDITAEVRGVLGELGVTCCLSAYGGVNPVDCDPLDIRRQGVNWSVSPLGLRAIVEGWRVGK